jgi:hypothetical protein
MPLKKCEFGTVEGLLGQVQTTHGAVVADKEAWMRTVGVTAQDMLDNTGGRFTEVNAAWEQVTNSMQEMQNQLRIQGTQAVAENAATVMRCAARYGG